MHVALFQGDMSTLHALLLEAEAHAPDTVQALTRIARRYDYDLLESIFSSASSLAASQSVFPDRPQAPIGPTPTS